MMAIKGAKQDTNLLKLLLKRDGGLGTTEDII